ncbi:hypothetical protein HELRODRAFT_98567 [Helobdella robusta]|uniref:Coactosin-like protein n=1 Tax=Helobdella robusta TaxID=6412 RepID=T1G9N7_HELRO|nr:hypothetical protein HELRODRAFT_98567 [Helobdella robusta]ESO07183.1 hypothetical protein HELRODRAFT_98567 [Helobdella robusta]
MADIQKHEIHEAYLDVRNDNSPTTWALLSYDNNAIILNSTGSDYEEFLSNFNEQERFFGYVRFSAGDEMSKRVKFVLITWIGSEVGALKKARVSTDKAFVKSICKSYAIEIQTSERSELELDHIKKALDKVGGANYGVGVRDDN